VTSKSDLAPRGVDVDRISVVRRLSQERGFDLFFDLRSRHIQLFEVVDATEKTMEKSSIPWRL